MRILGNSHPVIRFFECTYMMKYRLILFTLILLILTGCSNPASAKKGGAEDVIVSETREARESLRQTMEEAKSVLPEEAVARIEESEKKDDPSEEYFDEDTTESEEYFSETYERPDVEINTSKEDLQQMLKDNEDLTFYSTVPNDVTEQMRMGVYYSGSSPENIAYDYYRAFFENDSELHALINLENKTSACLTVSGDKIDVMIYEYVDNEETDAELMFSGMVYAEYQIDKNTGEIEQIM